MLCDAFAAVKPPALGAARRGFALRGAVVVGVRYGSGVMHSRTLGEQTVYWRGPSVGFDFGADASKVFVLVYNLSDAQQLFRRYIGAEGRAYFVGGFTATYKFFHITKPLYIFIFPLFV